MKYLGIDYGRARIGLAVSDEGGTFAFPLGVINNVRGLEEITKAVTDKGATSLVVGLPQAIEGMDQSLILEIQQFAEGLKAKIGLPVFFENEMLTSKIAEASSKASSDAAAAALILQSFLDRQNRVS